MFNVVFIRKLFLVKGLVEVFPFWKWVCWSVLNVKVQFQLGCVDHRLLFPVVAATAQLECVVGSIISDVVWANQYSILLGGFTYRHFGTNSQTLSAG